MIVVLLLIMRNHRALASTRTQKKYVFCFCESFEMVFLTYRGQMSAVDITAKSKEAYGLTKVSDLEEATYM